MLGGRAVVEGFGINSVSLSKVANVVSCSVNIGRESCLFSVVVVGSLCIGDEGE